MREAQLILPTHHNGTPGAVKLARKRVAETFGGYTADVAFGAWRNPETGELIEEPVERLTIAANDAPVQRAALQTIAKMYGREAHQDAVYIRHANGDVEIIPTRELWDTPVGDAAAA